MVFEFKARTEIPGPRSRQLAKELREYESPNITWVGEDGPIFWHAAREVTVTDVDGNIYLDLTAAFGVASVGHGNRRVVGRLRAQADRLMHAMGDVYPTEEKVALLKCLAEVAPGDLQQGILSCTGTEAVESALKTAVMATGKPGVVAFDGAYHGLGYGALALTSRAHFRQPFEAQLGQFVHRVPYPNPYRPPTGTTRDTCGEAVIEMVRDVIAQAETGATPVGAVVIEPILGRGGVVVPPEGFLRDLAVLCKAQGVLFIADEVMTGLGRTGRWFAVEHEEVLPDLLCAGKGMAGGFPLSVCLGTPQVMAAWGESQGEAIHTSTFLGSPVACAVGLAAMEELQGRDLLQRSADDGAWLLERLHKLMWSFPCVGDIRGRGMMIGIELVVDQASRQPHPELAHYMVSQALKRGVILLAGGEAGNVLTLTPPLTITRDQLSYAVNVIVEAYEAAHSAPVATS